LRLGEGLAFRIRPFAGRPAKANLLHKGGNQQLRRAVEWLDGGRVDIYPLLGNSLIAMRVSLVRTVIEN
jgi:hypothetical protein